MNTKNKIYDILKTLSGLDSINDNQKLKDDLALDSLLMVTLLIELEEALDIKLKESDMNPFDLITVTDVINLALKYSGGDDNE